MLWGITVRSYGTSKPSAVAHHMKDTQLNSFLQQLLSTSAFLHLPYYPKESAPPPKAAVLKSGSSSEAFLWASKLQNNRQRLRPLKAAPGAVSHGYGTFTQFPALAAVLLQALQRAEGLTSCPASASTSGEPPLLSWTQEQPRKPML